MDAERGYRFGRWAAVLAGAALVLTACGGGSKRGGRSSGPNKDAAEEKPPPAIPKSAEPKTKAVEKKPPPPPPPPQPRKSKKIEVVGRLTIWTEPPEPDAEEQYPDTITHNLYELSVVKSGDYSDRELLVVEWGQIEFNPTRTEHYQVGDVHRMVLIPFADAKTTVPSLVKLENPNPETKTYGSVDAVKRSDLKPYWVLKWEAADAEPGRGE